ncbi:peptide/nickel transport system permease protein [Planomicrobium koreense]|uniref:Peptide/nickel transport system permease protein n=1 Tax=Planococcus koreensis TaxID=112331 RepID=A0A7W8FS44_9BACL|nr:MULTISPECIES: ABC transporter permease [Planococcus]MBB5179678.1 peptide/nickel transport system permease protein [Planococcus koreensis]MDN3448681.1 ABC transporter permease [Planococcus sp. APC 3906]
MTEITEPIANEQKVKPQSSLKRLGKRLLKSKTGMVGLIIVVAVVLMAIFAPLLTDNDPAKTDVINRLLPPFWLEGGSTEFLLGTDNLGRDVLSRIIYGSRISLLIGISAVLLAGAIGMALGLIAGYYGKVWDFIIMRTVDSLLAIPNILFMLIILAVMGPSLITLILVLGGTSWVVYARMVRSETLSIKERDYVRSAKAIGAKDFRIITKYILPNVLSSFIVIATLNVATTIILEASLSFLGLGIQPPDVSWGLMLSDGREYIATSWWVATFPGIAITVTVLGVIFLGDWLRDVLDPKIKD